MDINNVLVRKIKCISNTDGNFWGCDGNHHLLEVGKEYTLADIDVHRRHTVVYLAEFPSIPFNSCAFEERDWDEDDDEDFEGEFKTFPGTDISINVDNADLEKFRYSLVGDGYLLEEVEPLSEEDLLEILRQRILAHINAEYDKTIRLGLLNDNEDDDDEC